MVLSSEGRAAYLVMHPFLSSSTQIPAHRNHTYPHDRHCEHACRGALLLLQPQLDSCTIPSFALLRAVILNESDHSQFIGVAKVFTFSAPSSRLIQAASCGCAPPYQ